MSQDITWTGDCPRCGVKRVTFNIEGYVYLYKESLIYKRYECFCICRSCYQSSIHLLEAANQNNSNLNEYSGSIDYIYESRGIVTVFGAVENCPDHVPEEFKRTFDEAARCLSFGCHEAAGSMFRKVLDQATRKLLPPQPENEDKSHPDYVAWKVRKDLRLRLDWLIDKELISKKLEPIVDSVREDGNDAAHASIGEIEARDLEDFTVVFLEALFTLPGQIEANKLRREARRNQAG